MKSDREIEESFHAGQTRILEMVASDAPLPEVLKQIVLLMEAQAEGMVCSILMLGPDQKHILHGAAPGLPAAYVKEVNGAPIGPRNGSCGTAMFMRKPVVVTDVLSDPLWSDYRELAKLLNLRSCWSTPILSPRGDVLGSFAIYRRESRLPEPYEKRLTAVATHIAGIAIDRQRAHTALREREARISLAAETADLGFWAIYPETNEAWMSDKGRLIYGFHPNLPLTRDLICDRVHPDERAGVHAAFDLACSRHGTFESQHRLVLPEGTVRWVIARGRCLLDDDGKLMELIGVTIDITAQKHAELQLQTQREEMAHLNRVSLMGEITASVAHEVNQPLTAIANTAAAGRRYLDKGRNDPAFFRELLEAMEADSLRASEIIRGIRSLVRKEKSERSILNLNTVIADTLRLVSGDVVTRESVVTSELDHNLPPVEAASVQMQQVLLNLIMNALDAIAPLPPAQRRVVVRTRCVEGAAEVSVQDFGPGLPGERPDKVFDHFFSTKTTGMGMGLTIVRSIIENHAGTIRAENVRAGGACFTFCLPAAQKRQTSQAA